MLSAGTRAGSAQLRTVRRRALEAGAVVGPPGRHHRDVRRVERRGCQGGMRVRRVRVPRVRVTVPRVRPHPRCGAARVTGERVVRRVRLHSVLPGCRLLPSVRTLVTSVHEKLLQSRPEFLGPRDQNIQSRLYIYI